MRNLKKVIALIAVLALTLSTVALGATYTDVAEDSAYSVAVESLSKLGIVTGYEDGSYGPEKSVTRAEMAALIARIQGYGETAKTQANTSFTDVPSSHWASGYVAYASNQQIVNGYGDGTFGPDDTVKYEQAVTMVMRTLGYEYFATTNGGYPTGYLAAAQRYGCTNGVSNAVVGADANRGTIAQLLYNAIDTPIMAPFKWNTNGEVEYAIYDGTDADYKTLMSENLGVIKIKGVVVENLTTALSGSKSIELAKEEEVSVELRDTFDSNHQDFKGYADWSVTDFEANPQVFDFLVGDSDIAEYLGKRVVLYAIEDADSDEFEIVACALDAASNTVAEFTVDQFDSLDTTGSKTKIKYYKNITDKDTTDLIIDAKGAQVVYNNVGGYTVAGTFGSGNIVDVNSLYGGKVTLIDNNSTSGYDVIFVEAGATAVVDEVTGSKVSFKENAMLPAGGSISSIKVDEDAEDEIFVFIKDGEEIAVTDLAEWDVLTIIANNKNADYIVAEVIGTPVTGTISATKSSDTSAANGLAYKIDSTYYDVADNAYKALNLQIGDAGIFYVDKYGKIAAFSEDSTVAGAAAGNYGFVLYAAYETGGVSDNVYQIKLLTANGVDIYDVASKVNYYLGDNSGTRTSQDSDTYFAGYDFLAANQFKLIKYSTNSNGEINTIYEAGYDNDKFAAVNAGSINAVSGRYDADNFSLGGILDEDATVFLLATAPTNDAITLDSNGKVTNNIFTIGGTNYKINTSECSMGTLADLVDEESYTGMTYLDQKGDDANLLVVTTGFGATSTSSNIAVLTDVSVGQNDEYDDCYILSYFLDGELVEGVYTTNTAFGKVNGLTEGDIVKLTVSSAGVITDISSLVNFEDGIRKANGGINIVQVDHDNDPSTSKVDDVNLGTVGKQTTVFGMATAFTKGTKTATINGTSYRLSSASNIYVIDSTLKVGKVDLGSAGDYEWNGNGVSDVDVYADYLFVRTYDGRVEDVVIVKNIWEDAEAEAAANYLAVAQANLTAAKDTLATKEAALTTAETTLATKVADGKALLTGLTGSETNAEIVTALQAVVDDGATTDVNEADVAAAAATAITDAEAAVATAKTEVATAKADVDAAQLVVDNLNK